MSAEDPLVLALNYRKIDLALQLITDGADIHVPDANGVTALHICAFHHDLLKPLSAMLERKDVFLDPKDRNGCTPLSWAVSRIPNADTVDAALLFIAKGAHSLAEDLKGLTPLHYAILVAQEAVTKAILAKGVRLDTIKFPNGGATPLLIALQAKAKSYCTFLIEAGVDVTVADDNGTTPLYAAIDSNLSDLAVQFINMGADVDVANRFNSTPLHIAASRYGKHEILPAILAKTRNINVRNNDSRTPLMLLLLGSDPESGWRYMLEAGADLTAVDKNSNTALMIALSSRRYSEALELIESGSPIDTINSGGETVLHKAAANEARDVLAALIPKFACIDPRDNRGVTPLMACLQFPFMNRNNETECWRLLVDAGANVNAVDADGRTPLVCAARHNRFNVELGVAASLALIECGADVNVGTNTDGQSAIHIAAGARSQLLFSTILERVLNVEGRDSQGWTPLMHAAVPGNIWAVEALIARGAAVNALNAQGETPLHFATDSTVAALLINNGALVAQRPPRSNQDAYPRLMELYRSEVSICD